MLKARTILCGLTCIGLAVGLCNCGNQDEGQTGIATEVGNRGQADNAGGKTASLATSETKPVKPVDEKRAALDGTEWNIDITHTIGTKKKTRTDKLIFENNRVSIEKFKAQGYQASKYSLEVRASGLVVWETAQRGKNGDILSLRGNWRGEKMKGSITKRSKSGENERFVFASTSSRRLETVSR